MIGRWVTKEESRPPRCLRKIKNVNFKGCSKLWFRGTNWSAHLPTRKWNSGRTSVCRKIWSICLHRLNLRESIYQVIVHVSLFFLSMSRLSGRHDIFFGAYCLHSAFIRPFSLIICRASDLRLFVLIFFLIFYFTKEWWSFHGVADVGFLTRFWIL